MCAEAKHSAERSPWHCCKNKRIANGAYPPRPRRLRFIYDTSEPNPTFASLPASTFLETLHLVSFLKIKKNLNLKKSELNSSLKFLSLAHIFFLYFTFPSPPLSSPSSFFSKERKRVKKLRRSSCKEENSNFVGNNIVTRYILEKLLKKQFLLPSCFMVPWPWCAIDLQPPRNKSCCRS